MIGVTVSVGGMVEVASRMAISVGIVVEVASEATVSVGGIVEVGFRIAGLQAAKRKVKNNRKDTYFFIFALLMVSTYNPLETVMQYYIPKPENAPHTKEKTIGCPDQMGFLLSMEVALIYSNPQKQYLRQLA